MGSSELIFRGGANESQHQSDGGQYSPKPQIRRLSLPSIPVAVVHRLLFVLLGVAIATLLFSLFPRTHPSVAGGDSYLAVPDADLRSAAAAAGTTTAWYVAEQRRLRSSVGGKVPLGLKRKGLRVVVTGGAGFVGSHLVDRLIERGDSVIVVDNFFTGNKENVMHHFGNPNFELIRHDVVEPLLLEVDQIYHLACPASPVHYKFNPANGDYKTNVVGTLNMLGLAKRVGARFLLTSTSEVYGDPSSIPKWRPTGETSIPSG
ncbi:putative UDP-glucuronic acid decarboxylase 4 [Iris pallida]|uniref:UDP-glucuronate decarboxylase n=1 Tax=Iris pallida TaxID=29817 RepID=A0AAX6E6I6_IRIPA|nr:putative UDP-glucuronic acid decarboxylase 4 [Iris pallida]